MPVDDADLAAIDAAIVEDATAGVRSFTSGDQTATTEPILDRLQARKELKAETALGGTNAYGGPVSGWNRTRAARFVPPGAST